MIQWIIRHSFVRFSMPLLGLVALGCAHKGEDVVTEIRNNLQAPSGVTVGRYPAKRLLFEDPVCMSKETDIYFFFLFSECIDKRSAIGDKLTREFALQDPTSLVEKRFVDNLTSWVGAGNLRILPKAVEPEKPSTIGSSLVIDFKTFELKFWSFGNTGYNEPNNMTMHFWFAVRSRATQVTEGRTLWAEVCFYRTNDRGEGPYRYGELLADNGAKVKQIIEHAADECGRELATKLLSANAD